MKEQINPERTYRRHLSTKEIVALGTGAVLAMSIAACSSEKEAASIEGVTDTTSAPTEVVIEDSVEDDDEFKLPKLESTYEYTPVITDAIIDYDLLNDWGELTNNHRSIRAFSFFEANNILPINLETIEVETGMSVGQAVINNLQDRLDLVYEVINDVTDPRNQEFGVEMAKYGIFYPEYNFSDENTDSYNEFLTDVELTAEFAGEASRPPEYRFDKVLQYTPKAYYSENRSAGGKALWIEAEGAKQSLDHDSYAIFQLLVFTKIHVPEKGQIGIYPLLVAVTDRYLDMYVRQDEEPLVVRSE